MSIKTDNINNKDGDRKALHDTSNSKDIIEYHNIVSKITNDYFKNIKDQELSFIQFLKEDLGRGVLFILMILTSFAIAILDIFGVLNNNIFISLSLILVILLFGILAVIRTNSINKRNEKKKEHSLINRNKDLLKLISVLKEYNLYSRDGIDGLIRLFSNPLEKYSENTVLYSERLLVVITIASSLLVSLATSIPSIWKALIVVGILICFMIIMYYAIIMRIKPHYKEYSRIISDLETLNLYLISKKQ